MATRYEEVGFQVEEMVERIAIDKFPELEGAHIKVIFDLKKKTKDGRIVVARIKKMNDELKFLAMTEEGLEYDYMIFIDKQVWDCLEDRDRERVIFHELCHTQVDTGKECPYNIKDHEIQGFHAETEYNADDPRWAERIHVICQSVHDPENNAPPSEKEEGDEENE